MRASSARLWTPGITRAKDRHGSLAAVVRSLVGAYNAGELDEVVERWMPVTGLIDDDGSGGEAPGPHTAHLPFPV